MTDSDFNKLKPGNIIRYQGKLVTVIDVFDDIIDIGTYVPNSLEVEPVKWCDIETQLIDSAISSKCPMEVSECVKNFDYIHDVQNYISDTYRIRLDITV